MTDSRETMRTRPGEPKMFEATVDSIKRLVPRWILEAGGSLEIADQAEAKHSPVLCVLPGKKGEQFGGQLLRRVLRHVVPALDRSANKIATPWLPDCEDGHRVSPYRHAWTKARESGR